MLRAKWNILTRWIIRISTGLRRVLSRPAQSPEAAPHNVQRGQVI